MQPYFFPYIGYFSLIKHTDKFILFDTVQFIRHGWIERNRMLKQQEGWQYIQVPIIKESGRNTLIKDVKINNTENWKSRILAQIQHYKKIAPNYFKVKNLIEDIFSDEFEDIVTLDFISLKKICSYLCIDTEIDVFSKMALSIEQAQAPDEWALNICKAMGSKEYWNPIGGMEFFDRNKYVSAGISIAFQCMNLEPYDQKRNPFEAGLSILDVMMFNPIDAIHHMMDDFILK